MWAFIVALFIGCAPIYAIAQGTSSWEGEWGSFKLVPYTNEMHALGSGLSISDCKTGSCKFSVIVEGEDDHGDASGYLEIQSPTLAIAHLLSVFNEEHCSLNLELAAAEQVVRVKPRTGDCAYFRSSRARFERDYPLHSRGHYVGDNVPACFASSEPALQSICASPALADQVKDWQELYLRVAELEAQPDELAHARKAHDEILAGCDHASDVPNCLQDGFAKSSRQLDARQTSWLANVTEPGDPVKAEAEARIIKGSYRHSFRNGDVGGDHFTSTDEFDIAALSDHTIRFSIDLQFYNGHECSMGGVAKFAKTGFFVYWGKEEDAGPLGCVLEIIPTNEGVKLADPTGGCKMISCGERGGYNGAAFSFKQRH